MQTAKLTFFDVDELQAGYYNSGDFTCWMKCALKMDAVRGLKNITCLFDC